MKVDGADRSRKRAEPVSSRTTYLLVTFHPARGRQPVDTQAHAGTPLRTRKKKGEKKSGCHNAPNVGSSSTGAFFDGVSGEAIRCFLYIRRAA